MDTLYVHIMSVKPFKAYIPTFIVRCLADIVQTYIRHMSDICPGMYDRHTSFLGFQLRFSPFHKRHLGPICILGLDIRL